MSLERCRLTKLDPDVADDVPWSEDITPYDEEHLVTYLRLLDADAEGAVAGGCAHRPSSGSSQGR